MDLLTICAAAKTTLQVVTLAQTCVNVYKKADVVISWSRYVVKKTCCIKKALSSQRGKTFNQEFLVVDESGKADPEDFVVLQAVYEPEQRCRCKQ